MALIFLFSKLSSSIHKKHYASDILHRLLKLAILLPFRRTFENPFQQNHIWISNLVIIMVFCIHYVSKRKANISNHLFFKWLEMNMKNGLRSLTRPQKESVIKKLASQKIVKKKIKWLTDCWMHLMAWSTNEKIHPTHWTQYSSHSHCCKMQRRRVRCSIGTCFLSNIHTLE